MKDELILICDCHSFEHQAIFYKDEELKMVFVSIRLKTYDNFFKRLWVGLKYAFGYTSKYGEWDEFIFQEKDEQELLNFLGKRNIPTEDLKTISCAFFRSWYNSPGNNTEQGFDEWWEENKGQFGN
jgi:hypothetical protein